MENETKKNFDRSILSNSYHDCIERVVGIKGNLTYDLPSQTKEKRQLFWDNLFNKYSEQLSDDVVLDIESFKPCPKKCTSKRSSEFKPKSIIQYWVNTGYLPYQPVAHKSCNSTCNHRSLERELGMSYTRPYCDGSSVSSSVDTAAYILSNINTTNKAETMAIVEGAKYDSLVNCSNTAIENTEIAQIVNGNINENNTNNDIGNDNTSNCQQYSPVTSNITSYTLQHENTDRQDNTVTLDETFDIRSPLSNKCTSYSQNVQSRLSTPVHSKQSYLEQSLLDCSAISVKRRTKLYTGRNSPVDLLTMTHDYKRVLGKLTHHLHPALDCRYPLQKKIKIPKRKTFKSCIFNKNLKNGTPPQLSGKKSDEVENGKNYANRLSSQLSDLEKLDSTICMDDEILNITNNIQDLNKRNDVETINTSSSNDLNERNDVETINTSSSNQLVNNDCKSDSERNKLANTVNQVEKTNTKLSKRTNNTFKRLKNINSVKRLTRSSKVDSLRHKKKSNKTVKAAKSLNPVIILTRLSSPDIQKYKRSRNDLHNLKPVIYLKKLSESQIQKYKRPTATTKIAKCLNAVVRLKRLSESDLLSGKVQSLNNNVNSFEPPLKTTIDHLRSSSNIINVIGDTDSDDSTLLICKCKTLSASTSNASVRSVNTVESHSLIFEAYSNNVSQIGETSKNLISRKDTANKQSTNDALNKSIDSEQYMCKTPSSRESEVSKNRSNDNVHTTIDEKKRSPFKMAQEPFNMNNDNVRTRTDKKRSSFKMAKEQFNMNNYLTNLRSRRSADKSNVTKEQNRNDYNNLIESGGCNKTGERNRNSISRKDTANEQSTNDALNNTIDSEENVCKTPSPCKSEMLRNRSNDNVRTRIDKKKKSPFKMAEEQFNMNNYLTNLRPRRSADKSNVTKEQNRNDYNNLIESGVCNKTGERNRNLISRKDTANEQNTNDALNNTIDSEENVCKTPSPCKSEMLRNRSNNSAHTTIDKKKRSPLTMAEESFNMNNDLINSRPCRSADKSNVSKDRICTKTGKNEFERRSPIRSPTRKKPRRGPIVEIRKDDKYNINYLRLETKLYDSSDSDIQSDSEVLSQF